MKTFGKKFKGKYHQCGKIGHLKRNCRSKSEKLEKPEKPDSRKEAKDSKNVETDKGLSVSSAFN